MRRFKNVDKFMLWDMMNLSVKINDPNTNQMVYEGKERGQTERYLISVGSVAVEYFSKIDELFDARDMQYNTDDVYSFLLQEFGATFVQFIKGLNDERVKHILETIRFAWKLKGTRCFLHWIIWNAFGWILTDITTLASRVFRYSSEYSVTYDYTIPEDELKLYYDSGIMMPEYMMKLVVDVLFDPLFESKHLVLEDLLRYWATSNTVVYINTL